MTGPDDPTAASAKGGPGTFRRAEEIFFEVAQLSPRDRDEAIARLCAGNQRLEQEVRSLVGSAAKLGAFLEQPALGKEFDQLTRESSKEPPDELIGTALGPFRIERRIGSGGMGTVYLAVRTDGQFDQRVAIKVVKRGMDSEEILRRFKAERQTLAGLDHPNIARLIDGGVTPDGRPYLIMEHIDGKPIDEYCDGKRLTVRERLALFREVCNGVQHAHQNLVIHRDLKPSNILVTEGGVPKLLDFGIAKVLQGGTTDAKVTADTDRRLTPEYASPEQVEGRPITTAADVYSLGVVLYEVLTGTRPYNIGIRSTEEIRRVVCLMVPPAPSDAVTVKGTRVRRTGPVTPAAATNGAEPAAAAPVDAPKTRGVTSTRLRGQLRGDLDTIVLMALRKEPERRYVSAEQLGADLGRYLDGLPVQARRDTLAYRASKFIRRHAVGVSLTAAAIVLLSTATVVLYRQAGQLQRQRDELSANYTKLEGQERELSAQRDELLASNSRLNENRRFLMAIIGGGDANNEGPDAKLGEVIRNTAATLASAPPSDPLSLAAAQQSLGQAMMSLGMLAEARPQLESAAKVFGALPVESEARRDIELDLAELLFYEGKHSEAEARFRQLLAEERSRNERKPTRREGTILTDLGASLRLQRKLEESVQVQREALAVRIGVAGERSLAVAETRNNLASTLLQSDDIEGAVAEYTRSLEVRRALLRPEHPLVVRCESNLGLALLRAGRVDEATPLLVQAAEAWERAFGPAHPGRVPTLTSLALALSKQGRFADGLAALARALDWQRANQPPDSIQIAATEANIGIMLADSGDRGGAVATLERVIPRLKVDDPTVASIAKRSREKLADLYEQAGQRDKARALRDELVKK